MMLSAPVSIRPVRHSHKSNPSVSEDAPQCSPQSNDVQVRRTRERSLVLYFRRSGAAALLVGAVMLLAPGTTPTSAVDSSSGVVRAVAATWRLAGTYPSQGSCLAAGPAVAAGSPWQCNPSPRVPAAYDLYVMT
jgi:hypothetical protein